MSKLQHYNGMSNIKNSSQQKSDWRAWLFFFFAVLILWLLSYVATESRDQRKAAGSPLREKLRVPLFLSHLSPQHHHSRQVAELRFVSTRN